MHAFRHFIIIQSRTSLPRTLRNVHFYLHNNSLYSRLCRERECVCVTSPRLPKEVRGRVMNPLSSSYSGQLAEFFLWEGKGCCRGENSQCRVWCLHCLGKWYEKSCYIVLWIGLMVQESCWVSQTIDSSPFSLHSWLVYFHLQEGAQATLFSIEFHVQFQISVFSPHFLIPKQVGEKIDTEKNSCVPAVAVKVKIKLSKDTGLLISAEKELQRQKVELTG